MNAPPQDNPDNTHRPATQLKAYVAFESDTVGPDFESEEWRVLRVEQGLGANHRALLQRDLGHVGKRIENRKLNPYETRLVEIWSLDSDTGERVFPLFRGKMMINRAAIAPGAEAEFVEAILPQSWFGDLCEGQRVSTEEEYETMIVDFDLEFNPLVDGRIVANRAIKDMSGDVGEFALLWVDPESARTSEAKRATGIGANSVRRWNIAEAVHGLQYYLNEEETDVRNFEAVVFDDDPPTPDAAFGEPPELEDEILPRGHYLPAYLDALLPKYGYQWTVDFKPTDEDEDVIKPQIRVYKRGNGITRTIPYQAIGKTLNTAETQPLSLELVTDLSRLANIVVGHGSLQEREVTIELYKGWPASQDETSLGTLKKTTEGYNLSNDNIWRKWVGNEAGDYNETRPEITEALDLSTVFEAGFASDPYYVPKRRPVDDCLTWRAKNETEAVRHPPILEYSLENGAEGSWKRAGQDWRPLTHEFGVYLTDSNANGLVRLLKNAGSDAKLRLTGTIRGDKRLSHEVDRTEESPSNLETRLFLDLSNRFHERLRQTTGPHASKLTGDFDYAYHQTELQEFVEKVADNEKAAVVELQIPLHGLVFDYEIGDVIEEIEGRKISLNRLPETANEVRGVQVVGRIWDVQSQQTFLQVAPFDSYVAFGTPLGRSV